MERNKALEKCFKAYQEGRNQLGNIQDPIRLERFALEYIATLAPEKREELTIRPTKLPRRQLKAYTDYFFWLMLAYQFDQEKVLEHSSFAITYQTICGHAKNYYEKTTMKNKKRYDEMEARYQKLRYYSHTFDEQKNWQFCHALLTKESSYEEILAELNITSVGQLNQYVRSFLHSYAVRENEQEAEAMKRNLEPLVEECIAVLKSQRLLYQQNLREEEDRKQLPLAIQFVSDYCASGMQKSKEAFWKDAFQYQTLDLTRIEALIEQYQPELYQTYQIQLEQKKIATYEQYKKQIPQILLGIQYGVMEGDHIRPFHLLDYYKLTNADLQWVASYLDECGTKDDVQQFRIFLQTYRFIRGNAPQLVQKITSPVKKIIQGQERIFSVEEQMAILDYLKQNQIPTYSAVFNLMLKEVMIGTLTDPVVVASPSMIQKKKRRS